MKWLEKITGKIQRRIPELENSENLTFVNDLIEDAVTQIVDFANANKYDKKWDNLLVNCAVTLYNYQGAEGTIERRGMGILDRYESSSILMPLLSANITPYIRPVGYVYSEDRYELPE